jgi:hypothetical protein
MGSRGVKMGVLKINYSELETSFKSAEKAYKKAESYAEKLEKKVCKKISGLEGGHSDNVNNADYFIKSKIASLKEKSERLKSFSGELDAFNDKVKNTDKEVDEKFSGLYSQFKKDNGLKINAVTEFFSYLGTRILNSTDFGKWLNNISRSVRDFCKDILGEIKYWYKCEGGKYVVDIVLSVVVIAVAIVTLATLGTGFFAVVALIGAVISIINAVNDICTSSRALMCHNEDPAWANRYGEMDKFSDTLRQTIDSRIADYAADALDLTEMFCDIVGIFEGLPDNISSYKEIFKNGNLTTGKKWLQFGGNLFKDQFISDFDDVKKFHSKLKNSKNISKTIKVFGYTILGMAGFKEGYDSIENIFQFKPEYLETTCDLFGVSHGVSYEFGLKADLEGYFDVDIEFEKDKSVFEKISDVFNPNFYSAKYGIKGMTPSDDMLESMGVFVQ